MPKNLEATTTNNTDSEYYSTVVTDTNYSSEYAKPTIKERFNNFLYDFERSQWYEFFYLKVVGGALLGATIAYCKYFFKHIKQWFFFKKTFIVYFVNKLKG